MKPAFAVAVGLAAVVAASGCVQQAEPTPAELAVGSCKALCSAELQKGADLSAGPCLGNPLQREGDWACDIAHDPRTAADDSPENQCSAFREGKARHFVELDPSCGVIKTY